ncbi:hypothetical protein R1sor_021645 [Riccia sorocarpa]|uniref:FAS1 domain-containing protein n=1 Tax=Riccia sorocarpa TaxID=122646 RepID=A0ABD3GJT4_9MARC
MGYVKALPAILVLLFLATASAQSPVSPPPAFNITTLLAGFPNFTVLNQLLSSTGVAEEINSRDSLTVLVTTDDVITAYQASNANNTNFNVSNVLLYHVLLQAFGLDDLKSLNAVNATSVTTLLQTTGTVAGNDGELNIYNQPSGIFFGPTVQGYSTNATFVDNITRVDYHISIIQIDQVLTPPPPAPIVLAPSNTRFEMELDKTQKRSSA